MGRGASIPSTARFAERFRAYVGVLGGDACWPWLGAVDGRSFPKIYVPKMGTTSARLWVWAMFRKGPVRKKLQPVCRHGNRMCCRPDHLELARLGRPRTRA